MSRLGGEEADEVLAERDGSLPQDGVPLGGAVDFTSGVLVMNVLFHQLHIDEGLHSVKGRGEQEGQVHGSREG